MGDRHIWAQSFTLLKADEKIFYLLGTLSFGFMYQCLKIEEFLLKKVPLRHLLNKVNDWTHKKYDKYSSTAK